ncbi:MAG: HPr(Ser) kinase/phosphatase [Kiritimatiellae bacterium]|nr:HPr(Ser) kinase/phosphatase [Kiritimatiellia bacterium]
MGRPPDIDGITPGRFTVADFVKAGAERLRLAVVAGSEAALSRVIEEPMVSRPGLALTGFFDHFAWRRLQMFGNAETAYLRSLPDAERLGRVSALFDRRAFCIIYTNGHKPRRDVVRVAEERGAVILASPLKTRELAYSATFVLANLGAPRTTLYGTMVEVCGIGVLFEGEPGMGKSETALGLVRRGHALVADDLTCVRKDVANDVLYGSASDSTAGFMEIRGIGIVHLQSVFGINAVRGEKRLELVITLKRLKDIEGEIDRIGQTRRYKTILGVDVPHIVLPVSEGRDLVNLVETAAQQQKLLLAGHDPVNELSERLRRRADAATVLRTRKG